MTTFPRPSQNRGSTQFMGIKTVTDCRNSCRVCLALRGKKLFKFKMQWLFVSGIGNSRIKKNHIFKLKCIFSCVKVSKAFAAARLWVKRLDLSTIEVHYSQEIREWYSHEIREWYSHNRAPPNPPIQQTSWWRIFCSGYFRHGWRQRYVYWTCS